MRLAAAAAVVAAAAMTLYVVDSEPGASATSVAGGQTPAAPSPTSTASPPVVPAPPEPSAVASPTPEPSPTPDPAELAAVRRTAAEQAAEEVLGTMSVADKVRQLLVLPVYGATIDDAAPGNQRLHGVATAREALQRWRPGGVILFREQPYGDTHNLDDPAQIRLLSEQVHGALDVPPLVAIDQEYGPIERLPEAATLLPSLMAVASGGEDVARAAAQLAALELAAVGVDVNFAPVADVQTNPDNPVIGVRAAGSDPDAVAAIVVAQLEGYEGLPVAPTVKHFPGHGDTGVDSHHGLPRIDHDRARLDAVELAPFRAAVEAGAPIVMTGHLQVPALDPSGAPTTLSAAMVDGVLRQELGFDGVVVSDSLQMNAVRAIAGDGELAVRAVEAGVDLLLMPTSTQDAVAGLESAVASGRITQERLDTSVRRVLLLKGLLGRLPGTSPPHDVPIDGVGSNRARQRAVALAADGITHLRGQCFTLPTGRVVVVAEEDAPAGAAMVEALQVGDHPVELVAVDRRPSGADRQAALAAAAPADLTVVWADPTEDSWRRLVDELAVANTVLVVLTDLPTEAVSMGAEGTVAAYGDAAVQGAALASLLREGTPPPGRLAVDVVGIGEAGTQQPCA